MVSGGQILVESLVKHGVERVFCVAGESFLPVLDAFLDTPQIQVITCRQESGASFAAEAYAHMTGKPGIVFVTRGPGACNASIGIHTARQASVPVIMFSGLIHSRDEGREAFQEFDIAAMFKPLAKDAFVIKTIPSISECVARAFETAQEGRPGPVVVGLPEDVLFESGESKAVAPKVIKRVKPSAKDLAAIGKKLSAAQRPVVVFGGSLWSDAECANLARFLKASNLPAAGGFRQQDILDHNHSSYIGELSFGPNPKMIERIKQADLVVFIGPRPDEVTAQFYTLLQKGQQTIHIYPDKKAFGKVFKPDLAVTAHPQDVVAALEAVDGSRWKTWADEARAEYVEWTTIPEKDVSWDGADMTAVFKQMQELLPRDAIVTIDAGNFAGWPQRYLKYTRPGRMLAPVCGAMGYSVPAAVSASLQNPDKVVVGFCGDGGFMMTGQELATAIHHGAKPIIIVCNNGIFGTIRMHQEREFPGRPSATTLTNPDFVALAESYGMFAGRVNKASDFKKLWGDVLKSGKAALIEIRMDPRQISTRSTL